MSNTNNNVNKPTVASSTVTRDLRELDKTTDNVYESLVIMAKRANLTITWKRFLKTVSKLKFLNTMKNYPNRF
jgi:hypothetical protein